jgi:SAP domain-containing new25/Domain of unknown function (DUF6434)
MQRPTLSSALSPAEFSRWYWLKNELCAFCRMQALPASGSKQELSQRIASYLTGVPPVHIPNTKKRLSAMPDHFDLSTIIGINWRCTQELRAFFESQVGAGFRFNEALRTFIFTRAGSTLKEALDHYQQSIRAQHKPIAKQFEYNRHIREFHATNPHATRNDAIAAWWAKRAQPEN